jgi:hypothetical protein
MGLPVWPATSRNARWCPLDAVRTKSSWLTPSSLASLLAYQWLLPLSVHQLPKLALQPMLDNMADRLQSWKGKLLNRTGRQALIKSTLATIPIYTAISIKLPPGSAKLWRRLWNLSFGWALRRSKEVNAWSPGVGFKYPCSVVAWLYQIHSWWVWRSDSGGPGSRAQISVGLGFTCRCRRIRPPRPFFQSVGALHRRQWAHGPLLVWPMACGVGHCGLLASLGRCRSRSPPKVTIGCFSPIQQRLDQRHHWPSQGAGSCSITWATTTSRWSCSGHKRTGWQTSIPSVKELWKARAPNKCFMFIWLALHGRC